MNEAEAKAKQQIVDKIKSATNILVTVSKDPSVDELSAALGLTAFLNKLEKHATAIFSGAIPPAISFLEPDRIFENTADSLRDFIIALDKEKADHLRYKVEGDLVKIFITPYRTTISEKDLEFTQGDYNIELVLALGVENQEHLDVALAANSNQILHDVTIATLSAGEQTSKLGSLDWREPNASCLSEMIVGLADSLNSAKSMIDRQISTALLTGIVASTDRFSNPKTTSRVMALSAQLMAAGADHQLIAAKLQETHEINSLPNASVEKIATAEPTAEESQAPSDTLSIHHDDVDDEPLTPVEPAMPPSSIPTPVEPEPTIPEPAPAPQSAPQSAIPESEPTPQPTPEPSSEISSTLPPTDISNQAISDVYSPTPAPTEEPLLGGILNSTSDQAAEDARHMLDEQQNKTILSHSYLDGSDAAQTVSINSASEAQDGEVVDIFSEAPNAASTIPPVADTVVEPLTPPEPAPAPTPTAPAEGLPLPPPLPDFSTLPPTTPPVTDNNTVQAQDSAVSTLSPSQEPGKDDPSQFKIPE